MRTETRETRAANAAKLWIGQYQKTDGTWKDLIGKESQDVAKELEALGPNPDPDKVDEIIGNNSWTRVPECDECGESKQAVMLFWTQSGSKCVCVCGMCLLKALNIMEECPV